MVAWIGLDWQHGGHGRTLGERSVERIRTIMFPCRITLMWRSEGRQESRITPRFLSPNNQGEGIFTENSGKEQV